MSKLLEVDDGPSSGRARAAPSMPPQEALPTVESDECLVRIASTQKKLN